MTMHKMKRTQKDEAVFSSMTHLFFKTGDIIVEDQKVYCHIEHNNFCKKKVNR